MSDQTAKTQTPIGTAADRPLWPVVATGTLWLLMIGFLAWVLTTQTVSG